MSFSNHEYLYQHLPSRFRREDKDLFLKRYLQFFGETLDDYDAKFDHFFESIDPTTASEEFVEFWLDNLFGWSWFPVWFTLADKRRLYANFGQHLARRGTRRGIELWLADFHIKARAVTRPVFTGEWAWGETDFFVADPLLILIKILYAEMQSLTEMASVGEAAWGESFYVDVEPLFTADEIADLLGYVQPHAQEILFVQTAGGTQPPRLSFYTIMNSKALRALSVPTDSANDLPEFLRFVATIISDLMRSDKLEGYTGDYTPLRTLDFNFAQLADAMNFARTLVDDYKAKRTFSDYVIANFVPLRTVNPSIDQLEEGLRVIMTIAADLGATASTIVPPDTTAPAVTITAPAEGATLSRSTNPFTATITDNSGEIRGIKFFVDDVELSGSEDTTPPYSVDIDETSLSPGEHILKVIGYDSAGNASAEATRTVIAPGPPDFLPSDLPLAVWFEPDKQGLANGALMSVLTNYKTGGGNDAVQATTVEQPVFVTDQANGRGIARFNGTCQFILSGMDAIAACTIYFVAKDTGATNFFLFSFGSDNRAVTSNFFTPGEYYFYDTPLTDIGANSLKNIDENSTPEFVKRTTSVGSTANGVWWIGSANVGAARAHTDLALLIVSTRILTTEEIAKLDVYAAKFGV